LLGLAKPYKRLFDAKTNWHAPRRRFYDTPSSLDDSKGQKARFKDIGTFRMRLTNHHYLE